MNKPDEAWGAKEVESYVGVSRITIYRLCARGEFPQPHYVLRHRKWWKADVVKWVKEHQQSQSNTELPTAMKKTKRVGCGRAVRCGKDGTLCGTCRLHGVNYGR